MKISKKISTLMALLLLVTTFNSHKTYTMEPISEEPSTPIELPLEMYAYMINLLTKISTTKTVREAGKIINTLAQTNSELNILINDPQFCLKLIKNLAQQFNCSDQEAAEALQTQEAKNRLDIQKQFFNLCKKENFNKQTFNELYEQYKGYVDLNFTFYDIGVNSKYELTLLSQGAMNNNCLLIETLLNHGANINKTTSTGATALMFAAAHGNLNTVKCLLNNLDIAINQQDINGWTVLLFAMLKPPSETLNLIIKLLLDAGANPEIAGDADLTPLKLAEDTNNQEIVELIKKVIEEKYEQQ